MTRIATVLVFTLFTLAVGARTALAQADGVGLGIAAGLDYSSADEILEDDSSTSFAWGFFVDIPLLETFVIAPQTTIYELDVRDDDPTSATDDDSISVTDVGLNFKFVVPLGRMSVGVGVLAGATTGLGDYRLHYGALGQLNFNLVSNLDGFLLAQFKRIDVGDDLLNEDIDKIHGFAGVMFRF